MILFLCINNKIIFTWWFEARWALIRLLLTARCAEKYCELVAFSICALRAKGDVFCCNLNASSTERIELICSSREFRDPHMTPSLQLYWSEARVWEACSTTSSQRPAANQKWQPKSVEKVFERRLYEASLVLLEASIIVRRQPENNSTDSISFISFHYFSTKHRSIWIEPWGLYQRLKHDFFLCWNHKRRVSTSTNNINYLPPQEIFFSSPFGFFGSKK